MQAALGGETAWTRIGLRQLSGMLILVFSRSHMQARPRCSSECAHRDMSRSGAVINAHRALPDRDLRYTPVIVLLQFAVVLLAP